MPSLASIVSLLFQVYSFLILIRVLLSWVNTNPYQPRIDHPLVRVLYQVTDPVLKPLQRVIPPIGGTLDISPIVALFALEIARRVVVGFLVRGF
jgi:YggT family protein